MNMAETAASELNHHIAGIVLVVIAVVAFLGSTRRFRAARFLWPAAFIALGLFLAAWSDAEIWPRGNLGWSWLLHHDLEARQHKIYALILLAIGAAELLHARGWLSQTWHRWTFPSLAACGALLLTMHAHGGTSGLPSTPRMSPGVAMAQEAVHASQADSNMAEMHHHHAMPASGEAAGQVGDSTAAPTHAEHVMTPAMVKIQRQHIWMAIVGVALALLKFVADSGTSRRLIKVAWPTAMASLGLLLVFYRE